MWVFMAGASSTGAVVARKSELRKSSARPCANFAIVFAVAGTTSSRSDWSASAMCSMSALSPGAHWLDTTRRRVIASKVSSPTKRRAARVITTVTSWPRFCRPRTTSTAL